MAKIYTKVGDQGSTRLLGQCEVSKNDPRVQAYGTVDELNSHLGLVRSLLKDFIPGQTLAQDLKHIQNKLFCVGSLLACGDDNWLAQLPSLEETDIQWLEKQIDLMTQDLAPLKQFILPGGSLVASHLHIARTVCRRAERATVEHYGVATSHPIYQKIYIYLNRLSDYLFTAARWANHQQKMTDELWEK